MGIIGMLELRRALGGLNESYLAPVDRDYYVY
jgi:hypothetical protein